MCWTMFLAVCLVVGGSASYHAAAQTQTSKEEIAQLLKKAIDQSYSSSFANEQLHSIENIRYTSGAKTINGSIEIASAGPDMSRREFRLADVGESVVVLGDKAYVTRNSLMALYLRQMIESVRGLFPRMLAVNNAVKRVYSGKGNLKCAELDGPPYGRNVCFDDSTGEIASARFQSKNGPNAVEAGVDHFAEFKGVLYPLHEFSTSSDETIDIERQPMQEVSKFADSVFVPSPNATAMDVCRPKAFTLVLPFQPGPEHPVMEDALQRELMVLMGRRSFTEFGQHVTLIYYVLVGSDAQVKKVVALVDADKALTRDIAAQLPDHHFPTETCNGKSIEYETIVHLDLGQ
jgi:hypothetical protein